MQCTIRIKETIQLLSTLRQALLPAENCLLQTIIENISDPTLQELHVLILDILNDTTVSAKSPAQMRHQECFAIRPGKNGLLDVARKT